MDYSVTDTKKKIDNSVRDGFAHWLGQTSTRALVSLLPPSEHTETVLRVAFEAGHGTGQGAVALMMIEGMMKRDEAGRR